MKDKINKVINLYLNTNNPNEKDSARLRLDHMCAKYDLDFDELIRSYESGEVNKARYYFTYSNKHERELLFSCMFMVTNESRLDYWKESNKKISIELTNTQYVDISEVYGYHRPKIKQKLEDLVTAYCLRNEIYSDSEPDEDHEIEIPSKPSDVAKMALAMDEDIYTPKRKQIEAGS